MQSPPPRVVGPVISIRTNSPKFAAVALTIGAHLDHVQDELDGRRLEFHLSRVPADFFAQVENDELLISARILSQKWELVMHLIAEAQDRRRRERRS